MNDKLKELAELANGLALAEFDDVSLRRFRLYPEIYDEKFSELIIQECCRIVNLWTDEDLPEGKEDVFQTIWIKKTFGVNDEH